MYNIQCTMYNVRCMMYPYEKKRVSSHCLRLFGRQLYGEKTGERVFPFLE